MCAASDTETVVMQLALKSVDYDCLERNGRVAISFNGNPDKLEKDSNILVYLEGDESRCMAVSISGIKRLSRSTLVTLAAV